MSSLPLDDASSTAAVKPYFLYLLECEGGRFYAGIALDPQKRFEVHSGGKGARFTRAWTPLRLLETRLYGSKGAALRAEILLKRLTKAKKREFFHL